MCTFVEKKDMEEQIKALLQYVTVAKLARAAKMSRANAWLIVDEFKKGGVSADHRLFEPLVQILKAASNVQV